MGTYVLRISCCALICGALGAISSDGGGVRKTVYGLFFMFMVISPLREIEWEEYLELPRSLLEEGERISEAAATNANEEIAAVITEELASYILVEAGSLGAEIQVVSIDLNPETLEPVGITLTGDISPYDRQLISACLSEELGIGKEQQIWNGET